MTDRIEAVAWRVCDRCLGTGFELVTPPTARDRDTLSSACWRCFGLGRLYFQPAEWEPASWALESLRAAVNRTTILGYKRTLAAVIGDALGRPIVTRTLTFGDFRKIRDALASYRATTSAQRLKGERG